MALICQEILSKEEFAELNERYMCDLEGTVQSHDLVWSSTQGILERQFYNEKGEAVSFLYRKDDNANYEIFCEE